MVKFIVHPGFVKTGSTFFQENIIPHVNNTLNLGKPYIQSNALQENLKIIIYSKSDKFKKLLLIKKISKQILLIIKSKKVNSIIFSDEAFLDSESYNPNKNIYYFKKLIKHLKKKTKIDLEFILTTREQSKLIISRFAYNYPSIKNKNQSLKSYIDNNIKSKSFFFESLKYFEFQNYIKKEFKCNVNIIPLEFLENNKVQYLKILKYIFSKDINVKNIKFLKKNVNSKNLNFYIKKGNFWYNFYLLIRKIKFLIPKRYIKFLKNYLFQKIKINKSSTSVKHDKYTSKKIYTYYAEDNKKLFKKKKINYLNIFN